MKLSMQRPEHTFLRGFRLLAGHISSSEGFACFETSRTSTVISDILHLLELLRNNVSHPEL